MRAVILAAGQGERLRPLTDDKPKCLVAVAGKPILHRQINVLRDTGISDITLIGGYQKQVLQKAGDEFGVKFLSNDNYQTTNMVTTLFTARELMTKDEDLLICYGDIIYERRVLDAVLNSKEPISIAIDKEWRRLWELRMDDPLSDAETLRLDENGKILELGQKPNSYDDIQGQYMGLIKVSASSLPEFVNVYDNLDKKALYESKSFDQMYMTAFIQHLINAGWHVQSVPVENGWLEVDTLDDLNAYEELYNAGQLDFYCKLNS